jgi:predicted nuclease with TOPRIM domain
MARPINRLAARILHGVGLERSRRGDELHQALKRSEQRIVDLKQALAHTRAEVQGTKARLRENLDEALAGRREDEERHRTRVEKLEARFREETEKLEARVRKQIARLEERDKARLSNVNDLRDKLLASERSIRIGRDHLMAIEVKLDLIEGAINLLDRRFRITSTSEPGMAPPGTTGNR